MKEYPIETTGVLCEGQLITIGWAEEHEYDLITNLRNKSSVREWFLDSRFLDITQNRTWLEKGMQRPKESLLTIRFKNDNSFLGTIGWTDWNLITATACFGRLTVDTQKMKQLKNSFPNNYIGVGVDASMTIRDFAFSKMQIEIGETYLLADNLMAKKVNESIGLKEVSRGVRLKPDGIKVETIEMRITKNEWLLLIEKRETK